LKAKVSICQIMDRGYVSRGPIVRHNHKRWAAVDDEAL
jgi:hypothetical protein